MYMKRIGYRAFKFSHCHWAMRRTCKTNPWNKQTLIRKDRNSLSLQYGWPATPHRTSFTPKFTRPPQPRQCRNKVRPGPVFHCTARSIQQCFSQRSDRGNRGTAKCRCNGYVFEFRFGEALIDISLFDQSSEPKTFLVSKIWLARRGSSLLLWPVEQLRRRQLPSGVWNKQYNGIRHLAHCGLPISLICRDTDWGPLQCCTPVFSSQAVYLCKKIYWQG